MSQTATHARIRAPRPGAFSKLAHVCFQCFDDDAGVRCRLCGKRMFQRIHIGRRCHDCDTARTASEATR